MSIDTSANPLPPHPALERIRRFRLLYAVAVNTVAIIVVAAVVMASRVTEFRTYGQIEVTGLADTTTLADVQKTIANSVRASAGDEALNRILIDSIRVHTPDRDTSDLHFTAEELNALRQRISFSVNSPTTGRSARITVALSGRGNQLEREVVKRFLASVSDLVSLESSASTTVRLPSIADINLLRDARSNALQTVNDQLQSLNRDLDSIAREVIEIAKVADSERERVATAENRTTNPFMKASFGNENSSVLMDPAAWRERFTRIPLTELSESFASIEEMWARTLQPLETAARQSSQSPVAKPMRTVSRTETSQIPWGPGTSREWILLVIAASLAIGCVLASGIDVRSHDPGLGKTEDIEQSLGVPVMGTVLPGSGSLPVRWHWSLRILKLNEVIVCTTLLAVVALVLTSQDIRESMTENPLHAISRVVWNLKTRG